MARWLPEDPSKAYSEKLFLAWTPVWMTGQAIVQRLGLQASMGDVGHMAFALASFLPLWLIPLVFPAAADRGRPLAERTVFKVNVWLWIFAFIQSFMGTHYFYRVLGMEYHFKIDWELNAVPIALYLLAFVFFTTYYVLMNLAWRRFGGTALGRNPLARFVVLFILGFMMAFGETYAMANPEMADVFLYRDRAAMLRYGSIFYGGLFVIGLPFWFAIDEKAGERTPMRKVVLDVLAANMLMLLWYETWRLALGPLVPGADGAAVPFVP